MKEVIIGIIIWFVLLLIYYYLSLPEPFTVPDARDNNTYDKVKTETEEKILIQPPLPEILHQNPDRPYICNSDFGWRGPPQYVSCANSSVADKFKSGATHLYPRQISCGYPNNLTAENYYKTYNVHDIPFWGSKDYNGYNYLDYGSFAMPMDVINMRILSTNTKGLPPEATKIKNIPVAFNARDPVVDMP